MAETYHSDVLGVSFGSYRRRCRNLLMARRGYVPLRRLGDVSLRLCWMFYLRIIWDVMETYYETSSLRPLQTSSRHANKTSWRHTTETPWRRSTETLLGVSFETYTQRCWDVQRDVVATSPQRLIAGWHNIVLSRCINNFAMSSIYECLCKQALYTAFELKAMIIM